MGRPREEGDVQMRSERVRLDISIHALVKRATFVLSGQYFRIMDFNPRPREEGDTHFYCFVNYLFWISIHALVKRATSTTNVTERDLLFQSTPS